MSYVFDFLFIDTTVDVVKVLESEAPHTVDIVTVLERELDSCMNSKSLLQVCFHLYCVFVCVRCVKERVVETAERPVEHPQAWRQPAQKT